MDATALPSRQCGILMARLMVSPERAKRECGMNRAPTALGSKPRLPPQLYAISAFPQPLSVLPTTWEGGKA
jgi:hypothetical protein